MCEALVRWGALKKGDVVVAGHQYGRVRAMMDTVTGDSMNVAKPVTPVRLVGIKELILPGQIFSSSKTRKQRGG